MSKLSKYAAVLMLVLVTSMALTMALNGVYAQDEEILPPPEEEEIPPPNQIPQIPLPQQDVQEAFVTVFSAAGGTTSPAPGTYRYPTGEWFNLTAVPYQGFRFLYWTISGSYLPGHNLPPIVYPDPIPEDYVPALPNPATAGFDSLITSQNPLNVICGYGYNYQYQPVFAPIAAPIAGANLTVVVLLEALGGTSKLTESGVTQNAPGTYTHAAGAKLTLTATPAEGYEFRYWIAKGPIDTTVVDNPADISCQEGVTYTYQPVFVPTTATEPGAGTPVEYFYAAIAVLAIIAVIGIAAALMFRSRGKK